MKRMIRLHRYTSVLISFSFNPSNIQADTIAKIRSLPPANPSFSQLIPGGSPEPGCAPPLEVFQQLVTEVAVGV